MIIWNELELYCKDIGVWMFIMSLIYKNLNYNIFKCLVMGNCINIVESFIMEKILVLRK